MSEQKPKIVFAIILAALLVSMLLGASVHFLPSEDVSPSVPLPSPQETSLLPLPTTDTVIPMPVPTSAPGSNSSLNFTNPFLTLGLLVKMSPSNDLNVSKGDSISVDVTLTSLSSDTEFEVPLGLALGAFQNQGLRDPNYLVITTPPPPYSSNLSWPAGYADPGGPKPFYATFSINPILLAPRENKTSTLIIQVAQNATSGVYSLIVMLCNSNQTGLSGASLTLTVRP